MKQICRTGMVWVFTCLLLSPAFAQNSVLINFGSNTCYTPNAPSFSLINNPLSGSPSILAGCDLSAQLPDFFSVFIAYNPKNNKVYVADIRNGIETKIWVLDMGLPLSIACPPVIPATPTYSYSYISNNFEFDNNGDLWSFSNYNLATGQCNMDKFDVATGSVISSRVLQFPDGNYPTSITSGDLTILPNGRMFATLGNFPSRLYEIHNYGGSNATATFLQTMPDNCYGIAYLNGQLEITGLDFVGSCYYFDYDISSNTLGEKKPFQVGEAPIDNTSFTPSVGTTKQLVNTVKVNENTADLTYEVYVKNLGNTVLNEINVSDDLASVFGAGNVSGVSTSFVPGENLAGLTLNPFYNGTGNNNLLRSGQRLPNQTSTTSNYYFKILLNCRVTNLNSTTNYLSSAIGKAIVGNSTNGSLISVSDSSNNGPQSVVDPNNNGNAGEVNENIPTPFSFGLVPVKFLKVAASFINKNSSLVQWTVATPTVNAEKFEVEFSSDGRRWTTLAMLPITAPNQGRYQYQHNLVAGGNLYYRIKETDIDGAYIYSQIVLLRSNSTEPGFVIFPNPANNLFQVSTSYNNSGKNNIELFDATGRKVFSKQMTNNTEDINTSAFPNGTYMLRLTHNGEAKTHKILVVH